MLCKMKNKFRLHCARKPLHIYDEEEEREMTVLTKGNLFIFVSLEIFTI